MTSTSTRRRTPNVILRYRERDTPFAVSRKTTTRLADALGMTETQVIHLALAELAARHLPQYAPDEGPLKPATLSQIRKRVRQGRMTADEKLF
jgi:hypothetical protein